MNTIHRLWSALRTRFARLVQSARTCTVRIIGAVARRSRTARAVAVEPVLATVQRITPTVRTVVASVYRKTTTGVVYARRIATTPVPLTTLARATIAVAFLAGFGRAVGMATVWEAAFTLVLNTLYASLVIAVFLLWVDRPIMRHQAVAIGSGPGADVLLGTNTPAVSNGAQPDLLDALSVVSSRAPSVSRIVAGQPDGMHATTVASSSELCDEIDLPRPSNRRARRRAASRGAS